jgi:hypothetical protein
MKLVSFLTFASFTVSAVFAQGIQIAYPTPNTSVTHGSNITITVVKPDTIDTDISVGLTIGMLQCTSPCPDPTQELGAVLYAGAFNPQFPPSSASNHQPQQNFTVTVPNFSGPVQLAAIHYALVGAGPSSTLQSTVEALTVT